MKTEIEETNKRVTELICVITNLEDDIEILSKKIIKSKVGEMQWMELANGGCATDLYPHVYVHKVMVEDDDIWLNDAGEATFYDLCIEDKIRLYRNIVESINF